MIPQLFCKWFCKSDIYNVVLELKKMRKIDQNGLLMRWRSQCDCYQLSVFEQVIVVAQFFLFAFHLDKEWPYPVGKQMEGYSLCINFQGLLWTLTVISGLSHKVTISPSTSVGPTLNCSLFFFSLTAWCGCIPLVGDVEQAWSSAEEDNFECLLAEQTEK